MFELNPLTVYSRSELLEAASVRALRRAVARGALRRLRRDVYVSAAMPDSLQGALSVGGSVCCTSALAEWGAWRPPGAGLHIAVPHNASRLSVPAVVPITVHWSMNPVSRPQSTPVDALARLIGCQPRAETIAVIDSALRAGIVSEPEVRAATSRAPAVRRIVLDDLDARAESGIESLARVALRDARLVVHHRLLVVAAVERAASNVAGVGVTFLRSEGGATPNDGAVAASASLYS